jgi:dGTPase
VQHEDDVRACGQRLVRFSDAMQTQSQALKHFLFHHLYRHEQVMHTMDAARQMVRELFDAYMAQPSMMKPRFAWRAQQAASLAARARAVADFVAGMTDRYAAKEHARITGQQLLPAAMN